MFNEHSLTSFSFKPDSILGNIGLEVAFFSPEEAFKGYEEYCLGTWKWEFQLVSVGHLDMLVNPLFLSWSHHVICLLLVLSDRLLYGWEYALYGLVCCVTVQSLSLRPKKGFVEEAERRKKGERKMQRKKREERENEENNLQIWNKRIFPNP